MMIALFAIGSTRKNHKNVFFNKDNILISYAVPVITVFNFVPFM